MKRWFAIAVCAAPLLAACGEEPPDLQISTPERARFDAEVYPVLMRDCSFQACHGSGQRFFQVYGPGRARLPPVADALEPGTEAEIAFTYDRARSMIDVARPERSLLLIKPLATSAGGTGHEGADRLGRNVYQSKQEPGYAAIAAWVMGGGAAMMLPGGSGGGGGSGGTGGFGP